MTEHLADEVIASRVVIEDDKLYHEQTQPTEELILRFNQELRKNPGALNDFGHHNRDTWGRWHARIPEIVFWKAIRDGYDLINNPKDMERFLQTEEGRKCLIRDDPRLAGRRIR